MHRYGDTMRGMPHAPKALYILALLAVSGVVFCRADGAGLSGEYAVNDKWRLAHAHLSPLENPALALSVDYPHLRYAGSRSMNEFTLQELGLLLPLGLYQTAGASWLYQGTADYKYYNAQGEEEGTISDHKNYWALTYAANPWRRLWVGINVDVAYERFHDDDMTGLGLDAGIACPLLYHPFWGTHTVGVAAKNLQYSRIGHDYPRTLTACWRGTWAGDKVRMGSNVAVRGTSKPMDWIVGGMMGIRLLRLIDLEGVFGYTRKGFDYYGGIAGVNMPMVNNGRDLVVQYQFLKLENGLTSHTVSLAFAFGRSREENMARAVAIRLNTAPSMEYARAMKLHFQGKYWEAYLAFGNIKSAYPDFFKMDCVDYYMSNCLEELSMTDAAEKSYEDVIAQYWNSPMMPSAYLGLLRIYHRRGDLGQVDTTFMTMMNVDVQDSVKQHAYYLYGLASQTRNRLPQALDAYTHVSPGHPVHPYALFSSAVATSMQGNLPSMRGYLEEVIATAPANQTNPEIVNKALVMLGYLQLEFNQKQEGGLAAAVAMLRRVPQSSRYYPEALVGLGWAAVWAREWEDGISVGSDLLKSAADPVLRAEGALLAGFSLLSRKEYSGALKKIEEGVVLVEKTVDAPDSTKVKGIRQDINGIAETFEVLAQRQQQPQAFAAIDSLRALFTPLKNDLDHIGIQEILSNRHQLFARNRETLKMDLGYLRAHVLQSLAKGRQERQREESIKKQNELDREIRQLQEQIKQSK